MKRFIFQEELWKMMTDPDFESAMNSDASSFVSMPGRFAHKGQHRKS
jgi:hypothetical protein